MSAFQIVALIFLSLIVLMTVYAITRFWWRLGEDDIEPAGSDGKAITGKH